MTCCGSGYVGRVVGPVSVYSGTRGCGRDRAPPGPPGTPGPPGPPGRNSLPLLIGFAATRLPRGVGFDFEFGGSPGPVCIVPLL